MVITDVRLETSEEAQRRIAFFSSKDKKLKSINWCNQHYRELIHWHEQFALTYPAALQELKRQQRERSFDKQDAENEIYLAVKEGETRLCACGAKLRFVNYGVDGFVGCPEYKDPITGPHLSANFRIIDRSSFDLQVDIPQNYLSAFKKAFREIPGDTQEAIIYKTLKFHKVKFLAQINEAKYEVGRFASIDSYTEELMIRQRLSEKFPKVLYQQGLQIFDGIKWYLRIPDYICSNDSTVYVLDAKKNFGCIDNEQLETYRMAVEHFAKKTGIDKEVKSAFILFNTNDVSPITLIENKCFDSQTLQGL